MSQLEKMKSDNGKSADIILTNQYLLINGCHYRIKNGYIHKEKQPVSILVNDVLNMEMVKMRSKRLLIVFIIMTSLLLLKAGSDVNDVHSAWKVGKQFRTELSDALTEVEKEGKVTTDSRDIIFYGALVLITGTVFFLYIGKPYHLYVVYCIGGTYGVNQQYYDKTSYTRMKQKCKGI